GRKLSSLCEEMSDTRSAKSGKLLLETRSGRGQKRDARFLRRGSREKRLASSRRTVKQDATRDSTTQPAKFLRTAQKLDRLRQLSARLVNTGHVLETDVLFAIVILEL